MLNLENTFFRRPRILNLLHRIGLVQATSQTIAEELDLLEHYARGKRSLLEIGTIKEFLRRA